MERNWMQTLQENILRQRGVTFWYALVFVVAGAFAGRLAEAVLLPISAAGLFFVGLVYVKCGEGRRPEDSRRLLLYLVILVIAVSAFGWGTLRLLGLTG